jgi:pyridoxamine 5'-phosphate oxidase
MESWLFNAIQTGQPEPLAMQLSTVGLDGRPHSRIVLLKGIEDGVLVFFTNYESAKGKELQENPKVAGLFFWPQLERQLRIEGSVTKVSEETSEAYFATRPRESQIGAWASPQSNVVDSQEKLVRLYETAEKRFVGQPVPRPTHWGGYAIKPVLFEFWQGQPGRLHHRFRYEEEGNIWKITQLAP